MSHQAYNIFDGIQFVPFVGAHGMSRLVTHPEVEASHNFLGNARKEMGE
jgi:hypothetical protein